MIRTEIDAHSVQQCHTDDPPEISPNVDHARRARIALHHRRRPGCAGTAGPQTPSSPRRRLRSSGSACTARPRATPPRLHPRPVRGPGRSPPRRSRRVPATALSSPYLWCRRRATAGASSARVYRRAECMPNGPDPPTPQPPEAPFMQVLNAGEGADHAALTGRCIRKRTGASRDRLVWTSQRRRGHQRQSSTTKASGRW